MWRTLGHELLIPSEPTLFWRIVAEHKQKHLQREYYVTTLTEAVKSPSLFKKSETLNGYCWKWMNGCLTPRRCRGSHLQSPSPISQSCQDLELRQIDPCEHDTNQIESILFNKFTCCLLNWLQNGCKKKIVAGYPYRSATFFLALKNEEGTFQLLDANHQGKRNGLPDEKKCTQRDSSHRRK